MTKGKVNMTQETKWLVEDEIQLFFALEGLKPVGINKHFYMLFISERLSKPAELIWNHLRTMYNLNAVEEPLPFPNDVKDFSLPESEFSSFLEKKREKSEEKHITDTNTSVEKEKLTKPTSQQGKESEKKVTEPPKRAQKRRRI